MLLNQTTQINKAFLPKVLMISNQTNQTCNAFAEVIESSLHGFLAQSWKWDQFPSFGSIVTIETKQRIVFGIVHEVKTGSMDSMRYPFPVSKNGRGAAA